MGTNGQHLLRLITPAAISAGGRLAQKGLAVVDPYCGAGRGHTVKHQLFAGRETGTRRQVHRGRLHSLLPHGEGHLSRRGLFVALGIQRDGSQRMSACGQSLRQLDPPSAIGADHRLAHHRLVKIEAHRGSSRCSAIERGQLTGCEAGCDMG